MKELLVHVHIYYHEQLSEILSYLKNLKSLDYDVYITSPKLTNTLKQQIKDVLPNAIIHKTENRGYDIGPFIDTLNQINLDNYKYILKLHSKGKKSSNYTWLNNKRLNNALWGKILWESLLKDQSRIKENIEKMNKNPNIGMLGSYYCYTNKNKDFQHLLPQINNELKTQNLPHLQNIQFIAGAMFLAKATLLKPLQTYTIKDFAQTNGKIKEGTFAHIIERLFGALITAQNHTIQTIKHDNYKLDFFLVSLKHFIFQKKITKSNKQIIKICKIPIYSKTI